MPVALNTIRQVWLYLKNDDTVMTGMASPADIDLVLKRDTGSGTGTAPETVTWTEKGSGYYDITFTPQGAGLYSLFLKELNALSAQRRWLFAFEVVAAGALFSPSFANAFCAETDVERWTQLAFDSSSKPTSLEVAAFAQARASEIRSVLASVGYVVSPSDSALTGTIQQDMLREANAIAAAADAYLAKFIDVEPGKTEKAAALLEEYQTRLTRLSDYAVDALAQSRIR